jgi:3,4-dihydroxy 2-butanone 4-phosphate synthase/GTP cyclohydrolase II
LHGVAVVERVPLVVGIGSHNEDYLAAKRDRMGHHIEEHHMLKGLAL